MTSLFMIMIIVCLFLTRTSGQLGSGGDLPQCADNINTNVQQKGFNRIRTGVQVVVINSNFTCDGRLNRIMASMLMESGNNEFLFQVWRPSLTDSNIYNRVGQIALRESDVTQVNNSGTTYWLLNMSLTAHEGIEFQAGDAMGYYHPTNPSYRVYNNPGVNTHMSHTLNSEVGPTDTFNRSNVTSSLNRQPLLSVDYDIRCDELSAPANGEITSCSSGRAGMGYEGDTCSFTCNTGYELTGSDTRICQSDGSWSGSEMMCRRVVCHAPLNGKVDCGSGLVVNMGLEGDNCTFSCDPGYMLQGSVTSGTCENNGSWNGGLPSCVPHNCSDLPVVANTRAPLSCDLTYQSQCTVSCDEGFTGDDVTYLCNVTSDPTMVDWVPIGGVGVMCERAQCVVELMHPINGMINCSLGDDGVSSYEDICSFTCNTGYELTGSDTRTCQSDGSWSGSPVSCVIMECASSSLPMNSMLAESCSSTYQSMCELQCQEGFTGTGDPSYVCDVLSNGSSVMWMAEEDAWRCERVQCTALMNGVLQCPNGTTTGVFEDSCTFSCNAGYELQGSNNGTCLANQSWSGGDPICVALNCSTSPPLNNSQLQSSCDTQYQSTCTTVCVDGYTGVGGSYTCVVTDEDTDSVGWKGSTSCQRVQCPALTDPINGMISCSLINSPVFSYEDTCSFTCDTGYELTGSDTRTCQSDGSWSGSEVSCRRGDLPQCADNINTNVQQKGFNRIRTGVQVVVINSNFTCDGRLNRIMASMLMESGSNEFLFQVWRPSLTDSNIYNRVGQIALRESDVTQVNNSGTTYWLVNMSLTAHEGIEFQAGDAMGYYHPTNPSYRVYNNPGVNNYMSHTLNSELGPTDTFNRSNVTSNLNRQPLLSVDYDIRCDELSAPANGEITSCSSGRVGVGYEGDTCSFTCNTGYELTGSDTRICHSDGSWSGSDVTCNRVICSYLTNPDNGMINCSLGDDGVPSHEDTCSFTCNIGYELTGSDTRTCQSDGSWSSSDVTCMEPAIDTSQSTLTEDSQGAGNGVIIGAIIGGVLLVTIIVVLMIIIIALLRRNKRSGSVKINYNPKAPQDEVNGCVAINPTYQSIEREKKAYSSPAEVEPTYEEIEDIPSVIRNPSFRLKSNINNYD